MFDFKSAKRVFCKKKQNKTVSFYNLSRPRHIRIIQADDVWMMGALYIQPELYAGFIIYQHEDWRGKSF